MKMVLTPRIFAIVRNCGLFPRLKKGIAQGMPKTRETYKQTIYFNWSDWASESICLVSDNDKAGGKHCTIWAVIACDFTSERELLYSPAKSNGVYSSPATDRLDCLARRLWWVWNMTFCSCHCHCSASQKHCLLFRPHLLPAAHLPLNTYWKKKKKKLFHIIHWYVGVFSQIFLTGTHPQIPSNRSLIQRGLERCFESPPRLCLWIDSATIST